MGELIVKYPKLHSHSKEMIFLDFGFPNLNNSPQISFTSWFRSSAIVLQHHLMLFPCFLRFDSEMEVRLFQVQVYSIQFLAVIFLISIRSFVLASCNVSEKILLSFIVKSLFRISVDLLCYCILYLQGRTCYIDEYIAKGYFKKYDSLIEQEFDSFIANNIPLGLCRVLEDKNHILPSLSALHQNVVGEGSHRRLASSLRIKLQRELKHELTAHSCEVVIIERLPSGVFADPFELQHLVQRGGIKLL